MNIIHSINIIQKTSSQRIERKRKQRLQTILQAALAVVMQEGLSGLTMQKLAEKLDYAVGALYCYSKDALLAALQRQILQDFSEVIQTADQRWQMTAVTWSSPAVSEKAQALARVLLISEVYFHWAKICSQRFRLLYEMPLSPQPLLGLKEGALVLQVALPLLQHLVGQFEQAALQGALHLGAEAREPFSTGLPYKGCSHSKK